MRVALAVISIGGAGTASFAHLGGTYPIYELPSSALPDLHDASIEDWEDALPSPTADFRSFVRGAAAADVLSPGSIAFRIFLAWHSTSQRIYGAVERVDDIYWRYIAEPVSDQTIFFCLSDCVEFLVDGDHGGERLFPETLARGVGPFQGENRLITQVLAQRWVLAPEPIDRWVDTGNRLGLANYLTDGWFTSPPYADAGGFVEGELPATSVTEFFLTPWDRLDVGGEATSAKSVLVPNAIIGFDVYIWDWDGPNASDLDVFTLDSFPDGSSAASFKDGILIPCDIEDCSQGPQSSAILPDSWSRIKAAVRTNAR